jgi:hypothetical protein
VADTLRKQQVNSDRATYRDLGKEIAISKEKDKKVEQR